MDWLYSDQGKSVGAIYKAEWMDDNFLYLMDMRVPKEDRTILKLDPNSPNEIIPLFEANKLMNNHGRLLIRKSGTEPKIRIMGESHNKKLILRCIKLIKRSIK